MAATKSSDYIPPLDRDTLETVIDTGRPPDWPDTIKQAELAYVSQWREARGDTPEQQDNRDNLVGLALSGGGIRSATFSLGVMQALAAKGLLRKLDYLSTVSGGGYIGSALSWLLSSKAEREYRQAANTDPAIEKTSKDQGKKLPPFGLDADNFPFGSDDPAPEVHPKAHPLQRAMLQYLRDHGYYLTPGAGISSLSLLGIVLRGTFLNVVMWMPLFVLFFVAQMWAAHHWAPATEGMLLLPQLMDNPPNTLYGYELFLFLGLFLLAVIICVTLIYSLGTWVLRGSSRSGKVYHLRRFAERHSAKVLAFIVLFLLVGSLPVISAHLHAAAAAVGPLAMLSGLGVAMRDFMKPKEGAASGGGYLAPLAAALFLFGGFLVAFDIAHPLVLFSREYTLPYAESFFGPGVKHSLLIVVSAVTIVFATVFGLFVNLNYISIHRYYRDRLMETFMPDIASARRNETGAASGANKARLSDMIEPGDPRAPYHIVNTNVVLVDSPQRVYRTRGGDNFMLSPFYCGSNATGWCPTGQFMDGKMTLATAMAISGAAANPNTGVGGVGLTRDRVVSFVMSLLNLRLGYWAGHPENSPRSTPNHFRPGLYAFWNAMGGKRWGFKEDGNFLALSDGGHFENMGIYELVRRRVRLIIACDGGADGDFSFSDFQTTVRRIEADFGTRIHVLKNASPDQVVPVPVGGAVYPKGAEFADQGHMVGCIRYPDGSKGWLIFLKTTLIQDLSFKVKGYAAQNKEFPDQSTIDQFFDEVQFEAYRELGYRLTDAMLAAPAPMKNNDPEQDRCEEVAAKAGDSTQTMAGFIEDYCR
jgi:predicted acylesterase/phospholipase RssA